MNTAEGNASHRTSIKRIAVVIDPGEALPGATEQSALLRRAVALAKAAGAQLELFYPCHDPSLELSLFASSEEVSREKERIVDRAATQMAELALAVQSTGLEVKHEVRWDHPESDAILRKIADSAPEIVMKRSVGPGYIVGLSRNTDWDLIRTAPAHVWFVKDQDQPSGPVLTAIGGTAVDSDIVTDSDYEVFRIGNQIAALIGAENHAVHCYQAPQVNAFATYAPFVAGATNVIPQPQIWQDVAELHGQAIGRFAERFDIDAADIVILKGHVANALPQQAEKVGAGLVVMGARNLGRWERVFSGVTAEPVLAEAPCDVLIVKEERDAQIAEAHDPPRIGHPDIDVETAVIHPDKAFENPMAVLRADHLSGALRRRILEVWELDIQAQLRAEEEGGSVRSTKAGVLEDIRTARRELDGAPQRRAG